MVLWCVVSERRRASGGVSLEELRRNMQFPPIDRNGLYRSSVIITMCHLLVEWWLMGKQSSLLSIKKMFFLGLMKEMGLSGIIVLVIIFPDFGVLCLFCNLCTALASKWNLISSFIFHYQSFVQLFFLIINSSFTWISCIMIDAEIKKEYIYIYRI